MGRKRYKPQEIVAKLRRACGDGHRLEATELAAASTGGHCSADCESQPCPGRRPFRPGLFLFLRPILAMVAPDRGRIATITLWKN